MPGASGDDIIGNHDSLVHVGGASLFCIQRALGNGGHLSTLDTAGRRQDFDTMANAGDRFTCLVDGPGGVE